MASPSRWRPGHAALMCSVALLQSSLPAVEGIFDPPAPKCPSFTCPAGQKAVGRPDHTISSFGCRDSGVNFAGMANLNGMPGGNPFANLQTPKLNKCCVEKDLCRQTCGMSAKACHDKFQACTGKICGNDQNCKLQAMMSDFKTEAYDDEESKKPDAKYDADAAKCKPYNKGQKDACMCVPEAQFKSAVERKLKAFYSKFNQKKLDRSGNIIDVDEVWKKWSGKEADMFMALASKYKDKAVKMKSDPTPPPFSSPPPPPPSSSSRPTRREEPPARDEEDDGPEIDVGGDSPAEAEDQSTVESSTKDVDPQEQAFDQKYESAMSKKRKAVDDEDYDAADRAKGEIAELAQSELKRLQALKAQAVKDEDFIEAKRIKARMSKLEL